jgi:lysophospholipase L1-like esterase
MFRMKRLAAVLALALLAGPPLAGQGTSRPHWVGTWMTSVIGRPPYVATRAPATQPGGAPAPPAAARMTFPNNQTLRQIVHTTLGGDRVRVILSNVFNAAPLTIGAAHVAVRAKDAAIVAGTGRVLMFSGVATTTIPAGAIVVSDPVALGVPPFADLAIDLYLPDDAEGRTMTVHRGALQTSYLVAGNHAGEADWPTAATINSWYYLQAVEVAAPERTPVVVAAGDSITDGSGSTADSNNRWPDHFARRLAEQHKGAKIAVLNAGIGGNRVLSEGTPESGINILARFDRDVLMRSGVTHVVVMEGINDIGNARESARPSAEELIAAHKQLIERAHDRGLKIIGATLTPFEGAAYYTAIGEAKRQAVNEWIRVGRAYDGVIDFDLAVRDAAQPKKFVPEYDRGDHLHPSDAGYRAMANAIQLGLFK